MTDAFSLLKKFNIFIKNDQEISGFTQFMFMIVKICLIWGQRKTNDLDGLLIKLLKV